MGKSRTNHAYFQDEYALRHKKGEGAENSKRKSRNLTKQWESLIEEDPEELWDEDSTPSAGEYFLGELE
jgi:DNA-binding SARP family transcriptional activator